MLLPNVSEGCPYIPEDCTKLELEPVPRADSCHQQEGSHLSQQVQAADAVNVRCSGFAFKI